MLKVGTKEHALFLSYRKSIFKWTLFQNLHFYKVRKINYFFPFKIGLLVVGNSKYDVQDRETGYDTLIISCWNLMFDAPKRYDKLNHFPILSWLSFVIYILNIDWVRNYPDEIRRSFLIYYLDNLLFLKYCHF